MSEPKLSECSQCECTGVTAFFSWSFLHPNCQCAANVNVLVVPHFYLAISVPKFPECAKCECAHLTAFVSWSFMCQNCQSAPNVNALLIISAPKWSECAQCECFGVATFFTWPFLHPNCQSAPHMIVLVLPHFLAGCFCAQILRGHPTSMSWCCRIFYLAISVLKLSECAPYL